MGCERKSSLMGINGGEGSRKMSPSLKPRSNGS